MIEFTTVQAHVFKEIVVEDRILPSRCGAYMNGDGKYQHMYDFLKNTSMDLAGDKVGVVFWSMARVYQEAHVNKFVNISSDEMLKPVRTLVKWYDEHGQTFAPDEDCEEFANWLSDCTYLQESSSEEDENIDDEDDETLLDFFNEEYECFCKGGNAGMDIFMDGVIEWTAQRLVKRMRSAEVAPRRPKSSGQKRKRVYTDENDV
jgi:hypothetical protein